MVIEPRMQAPSISFEVKFTASRRGVVVELPGRRLVISRDALLHAMPFVRRLLSCVS